MFSRNYGPFEASRSKNGSSDFKDVNILQFLWGPLITTPVESSPMDAPQPLNDTSDVNVKSVDGWSMALKEVYKFANHQFSSYLSFGEICIFASKLPLDIFSASTLSFSSTL